MNKIPETFVGESESEVTHDDKSSLIIRDETSAQLSQAVEVNETLERMVVVVCGPPHSGKSVFFTNLKEYLPRQGTHLFRACPDGEGSWSQRADSEVAASIRNKGKFTEEFVKFSSSSIKRIKSSRVLVDVGGLRTPENKAIFAEATHFVVLCRSDRPEEREAWEKFGRQAGLELLASIESVLEGDEELEVGEVIRGRISGLERGAENDSQVIEELAARIIAKTPNNLTKNLVERVDMINKISLDTLAKLIEVPYENKVIHRHTERERIIKNPVWTGKKTREAIKVIESLNLEGDIWLDGPQPAFLYAAVTYSLQSREIWLTDFKVANGRKQIPRLWPYNKKKYQLDWTVEERDSYTLLDIKIPNSGVFEMDNLDQLILPLVNPFKGVVLSGKLPYLIFATLVKWLKSTKTPWIAIYTPQQKNDAGITSPAMVIGSEENGPEIGSYINCPII